jgi:hypothetical protein
MMRTRRIHYHIRGNLGKNRISVSPPSQLTDEGGDATFTITARNTIGMAKVIFTAEYGIHFDHSVKRILTHFFRYCAR